MNREAILAAIPHRPPMLLVDEIVEQSEDRIVCRKTFQADEFFFICVPDDSEEIATNSGRQFVGELDAYWSVLSRNNHYSKIVGRH